MSVFSKVRSRLHAKQYAQFVVAIFGVCIFCFISYRVTGSIGTFFWMSGPITPLVILIALIHYLSKKNSGNIDSDHESALTTPDTLDNNTSKKNVIDRGAAVTTPSSLQCLTFYLLCFLSVMGVMALAFGLMAVFVLGAISGASNSGPYMFVIILGGFVSVLYLVKSVTNWRNGLFSKSFFYGCVSAAVFPLELIWFVSSVLQ